MIKENKFILVCLAYIIIVIAFEWNYFNIMGAITPFLMIIPVVILRALFALLLIFAINHILMKIKKEKIKAFLPLTLLCILFFIVAYAPIGEWRRVLDFNVYLEKREYIVNLINNNQLQHDEYSNYILPKGYQYLSQSGEVTVEKQNGKTIVLFYENRGILDNFSGWFYISNDASLQNGDHGGEYFENKKLKDHWYFGASN